MCRINSLGTDFSWIPTNPKLSSRGAGSICNPPFTGVCFGTGVGVTAFVGTGVGAGVGVAGSVRIGDGVGVAVCEELEVLVGVPVFAAVGLPVDVLVGVPADVDVALWVGLGVSCAKALFPRPITIRTVATKSISRAGLATRRLEDGMCFPPGSMKAKLR